MFEKHSFPTARNFHSLKSCRGTRTTRDIQECSAHLRPTYIYEIHLPMKIHNTSILMVTVIGLGTRRILVQLLVEPSTCSVTSDTPHYLTYSRRPDSVHAASQLQVETVFISYAVSIAEVSCIYILKGYTKLY
ncbi:neuroendocrine convertase 1 [Platysternon megacephalum]|uniref:Neuroendocrine convertase 1 n=1 Tax=Platysternon megacephalum TaxID=55544 RepID=A0A4D9FCY9_9SAUR|nr:neuroendocrine convertase 1 [Platysternon megacephalum]